MSESQLSVMDGYRIAARVVFPTDGDPDVLPLYVDRGEIQRNSGTGTRPEDVLSRRSLRVPAGQTASLGSYFNAFPASYWKRWTVAGSVRLNMQVSGAGMVAVYSSTSFGHAQRSHIFQVDGDQQHIQVDLPLASFNEGGWYWFDLIAKGSELTLEQADWWVPTEGSAHRTATISTTTMNKTDYIVRNMNLIADDAELVSLLDEILVVDHGSQKVVEADGFAEVSQRFAGKLQVIEQPNLGGSGGFARGQYEAAKRGLSDYVLLMDDDISVDTETVLRMITFADMCRKPTLVGGHMFDLMNRSTLHTMGEAINSAKWVWTPPKRNQYLAHSFARRGLRETKWMHSRVDVDYNAWWCCLIPTETVRKIGLSLPFFIKWDDVEYGIRAGKAGYPTVSLPGAAVWHMSWVGKDDRVGWQAYFHNRNRIIAALIHSPVKRGGQLLLNAEINDLTHLVAMQYCTVAGRLMAERDVLAGPEGLHALLATRLGDIKAMEKDYDDSQFKPDYDAYPAAPAIQWGPGFRPRIQANTEVGIQRDLDADEEPPMSYKQLAVVGAKALLRQFKRVPDEALQRPQTSIDNPNKQWWKLAQFDSALVINAEGSGIAWYRRRPELVRQMLAQSVRNYAKILRNWDDLAARYRAALPELTSFEAWEKTFGITAPRDEESAKARS